MTPAYLSLRGQQQRQNQHVANQPCLNSKNVALIVCVTEPTAHEFEKQSVEDTDLTYRFL